MVAATVKPEPPLEGSGGEAMPGIKRIPAISERVIKWVLWHLDEKCPKNPSLPYDSCTGCQELQERDGIDSNYSDSDFNTPPHGPQVRSMTRKFLDVMINALKEWGMLNWEYPAVEKPKRKERKQRFTHVSR